MNTTHKKCDLLTIYGWIQSHLVFSGIPIIDIVADEEREKNRSGIIILLITSHSVHFQQLNFLVECRRNSRHTLIHFVDGRVVSNYVA